jgi:hypothetical protein
VPDPVNEAMLRQLENTFHNMQSHYDTHLAHTEVEQMDEDLPLLRGDVSVVFHLLGTSVLFVHFYERHLAPGVASMPAALQFPVDPEDLLGVAFNYAIAYARTYLEGARQICRAVVQRYSETGRVTLPVPPYRGFHVRPSTLIAKIVQHYGSAVKMILFDEEYEAGEPIDLFRANEQINALKRRGIAEQVGRIDLKGGLSPEEARREVRRVVLELAERGALVIYEQPLKLAGCALQEGVPLSQYVVDEIGRLLALGKIDLEADTRVAFVGDVRVLADIQALAESGYGEDRFGNNIALPPQLAYLRR